MNEQNPPVEAHDGEAPFPFRYSTHPDHLEAPREWLAVRELKDIIARHVAGFDSSQRLVLEDAGDEPDRLLSDDDVVEINAVPHFYSERQQRDYTIIVNAEQKIVHERELTFEAIVKIAFPNPQPRQDVRYTVTYKRAVKPKHQGHLLEGQSVTIRRHGTIFDVVRTYKS